MSGDELGPVSASLEAELRDLARQRGIVVWLDKEGSYTAFADALVKRPTDPGRTVPIKTFRGSYLETMLALEDLQDGVGMTPLVVHVPGHTEETIAETPLFELYRAGSRHRRCRDPEAVLARGVARQRRQLQCLRRRRCGEARRMTGVFDRGRHRHEDRSRVATRCGSGKDDMGSGARGIRGAGGRR